MVKTEIEEKIKEILENDLNSDIENTMSDLDREVTKNKEKLLKLFNLGLEKELKKGKYKTEIDVIVKFSFYEKLQLNLSTTGIDLKSYKKGISSIGFLIASYFVFNIYSLE